MARAFTITRLKPTRCWAECGTIPYSPRRGRSASILTIRLFFRRTIPGPVQITSTVRRKLRKAGRPCQSFVLPGTWWRASKPSAPWWKKDVRETALSDRIQKFLYGQGIHSFADRYTLDGKPLSRRHSVGMAATTAVGSFATTPGPVSKAFLEELWTTPVPSGEQRYYDGLLYLMSMMHCSGTFRIY